MFAKDLFINIHNVIVNSVPNSKVYLVGECVRNILLGKKVNKFDFFIESKELDSINKLMPRLCVFRNCSFIYGKKINFDYEIITTNCLFYDINDIINGKNNIQSLNNGLKDFNKKIIKITEKAKANFDENPSLVLNILNYLDETDFHIDSNTAYFLFTKRPLFTNIDKRKLFNFLKETLKKNYPRKFISYINTFGISKLIFNTNLIEISALNHLKPTDTYEFFSLIFDNIESNSLEYFLVNTCGFLLKDVDQVMKVSKIIRNIKDESDEQAIEILKIVDKNRIPNLCRLLRALNYKSLSKKIRYLKGSFYKQNNLCIDENSIKVAFGIDDKQVIDELLKIAFYKIKETPEFNEPAKILLFLNSERGKLCEKAD